MADRTWQAPTGLLVGGEWRASTGAGFPVENPATGEAFARVADAGPEDARAAVAAAREAFAAWREAGAYARSALLEGWHQRILADRENLARIMTLENGKPYPEALGEVDYAASFVRWFAEEAKRAYGRTIPAGQPGKRLLALRQPVGVVAAITPWNFPAAMITRKVAPALAAGCSVVLKPAEQTPLTALRLAELLQDAGAAPGLLNVLATSRPAEVADAMLASSDVRKITFTGSTEVGKILMRRAADRMQRLSLELGGQAPFLVFADADLDVAIESLVVAKFRNGGQSCIAANRVLVQEEVVEEFLSRAGERLGALRIGDGFDPGVHVGPLIDEEGRRKVLGHVEDAVAQGARLLQGGGAPAGPGHFVQPTLLADVRPGMRVMREETFGPVVAVAPFASEREAVEIANSTEYGLAAYFFTRDVSRAWRVAESLDYGIVSLNDGLPSTAQAPFGGFKESGFAREGGSEGLDAFLETKYLNWGAVGTGLLGG